MLLRSSHEARSGACAKVRSKTSRTRSDVRSGDQAPRSGSHHASGPKSSRGRCRPNVFRPRQRQAAPRSTQDPASQAIRSARCSIARVSAVRSRNLCPRLPASRFPLRDIGDARLANAGRIALRWVRARTRMVTFAAVLRALRTNSTTFTASASSSCPTNGWRGHCGGEPNTVHWARSGDTGIAPVVMFSAGGMTSGNVSFTQSTNPESERKFAVSCSGSKRDLADALPAGFQKDAHLGLSEPVYRLHRIADSENGPSISGFPAGGQTQQEVVTGSPTCPGTHPPADAECGSRR